MFRHDSWCFWIQNDFEFRKVQKSSFQETIDFMQSLDINTFEALPEVKNNIFILELWEFVNKKFSQNPLTVFCFINISVKSNPTKISWYTHVFPKWQHEKGKAGKFRKLPQKLLNRKRTFLFLKKLTFVNKKLAP